MTKKIANSVLSSYGSALGIIEFGRTERMRKEGASLAKELEEKYPSIAEEYGKWQRKLKKARPSFRLSKND